MKAIIPVAFTYPFLQWFKITTSIGMKAGMCTAIMASAGDRTFLVVKKPS